MVRCRFFRKNTNRMKGICKLCLLLCSFLWLSCNSGNKIVIGVSQCSSDEWRDQMNAEMRREAFLHPELQLEIVSSDDDSRKQIRDIESFIERKVDLIIVSPNEEITLRPVVEKAFDAGIPVLLVDRKVDTDKYTAYIGGDNMEVGRQAAEYIVSRLPSGGNIVMIEGLASASASKERKAAFLQVMDRHPEIRIVADIVADWKKDKARAKMDSLNLDGSRIDVVFAFNDRMAVGAWESLRRSDILYIGVDALLDGNVGISRIEDGTLDASFLYPTAGDKAIHTAFCILNNMPYDRETVMQTGIVNKANVHMMRLQALHIAELDARIEYLNGRLADYFKSYSNQRQVLWISFFLIMVLCCLSVVAYHASRVKHRLNRALQNQKEILERQRDELAEQKEMVERQRDLLEEERDKQIELDYARTRAASKEEDTVLPANDDPFYKKLVQVIENNMENTSLSVDVLGAEVNLGRVQLYRKCKAASGLSPNELIRTLRLNKAYRLLQESDMTISEISYSVGFSSPSYFAKCYKDHFGKNPTDSQKK